MFPRTKLTLVFDVTSRERFTVIDLNVGELFRERATIIASFIVRYNFLWFIVWCLPSPCPVCERLLDLLENCKLGFEAKHLKTLVLDEADHLLEMGFRPAIEKILLNLPSKVIHAPG